MIGLAACDAPSQYFPGFDQRPWYYPTIPPRAPGHWEWVPDTYRYPGSCDACRDSGICHCYRPDHGPIVAFTVVSSSDSDLRLN